MSENDNNESTERDEISGNPDKTLNMHVNDFIEYSDSVDDRMMELVKSWRESGEMNPNKMNCDRREYDDLDSESDDDNILSSYNQKCPETRNDDHLKTRVKYDISCDGNNHPSRIRNQQIETEQQQMTSNGVSCGVEELVRKFSTIELLRERENLRKTRECETVKPCCISGKAHQPSEENRQNMSPEDFLGYKRLGKKCQDTSKRKIGTSEAMDESLSNDEEEDDEIDEIVQMLSSSSLIKDYDEILTFPNQEDEILKAFVDSEESPEKHSEVSNKKQNVAVYSEIDVQDGEFERTSRNQSSDDVFDWKTDTTEDACSVIDGYEIDDPCSFHDWMIDDILSKPLNTSYDSELSFCTKCFSCHNSKQKCVQE